MLFVLAATSADRSHCFWSDAVLTRKCLTNYLRCTRAGQVDLLVREGLRFLPSLMALGMLEGPVELVAVLADQEALGLVATVMTQLMAVAEGACSHSL